MQYPVETWKFGNDSAMVIEPLPMVAIVAHFELQHFSPLGQFVSPLHEL